jgi:hypothetical protein
MLLNITVMKQDKEVKYVAIYNVYNPYNACYWTLRWIIEWIVLGTWSVCFKLYCIYIIRLNTKFHLKSHHLHHLEFVSSFRNLSNVHFSQSSVAPQLRWSETFNFCFVLCWLCVHCVNIDSLVFEYRLLSSK